MTIDASAPRPIPTLVEQGDPEAVTRAAAALRAGMVVAVPTDTVYGLAAAIDRPHAIDRLYSLKGRPTAKAIPVLLGDRSDVERVTFDLSPAALALADRYWPGALTLVVPALPDLPEAVTTTAADGTRTVAVRVPGHDLARQIIAAAGGALAVTSANRSGENPALDAHEVLQLGDGAPDIVVDGGRAPRAMPSTIVRALTSQVEVLREGAVPVQDIERTIGSDVERVMLDKPDP